MYGYYEKTLEVALLNAAIFTGAVTTDNINHAQAYMITCAQERNDGYNAYMEKVLSQEHYKDAGLSMLYVCTRL